MTRFATLLLLLAASLQAQKAIDPDKIRQFNVTINQEDQIVKTQILKNPKRVQLDNDATYTWYTANQLVETRGGYDGRLLHGYYKAFFFNNQLRESGQMRYGLRQGKWRYWYSNGNLREIISWKKGRKHGLYAIYNDQGKLMAKGRFKNNLLHGKFYTYDISGKISDTRRYRNGEEVKSQEKPAKIKEEPAKLSKEEKAAAKAKKKEQKAEQRRLRREKKSTQPSPDAIAPQEKPQEDSTRKDNFFHRLFKKKKSAEPTSQPTGTPA